MKSLSERLLEPGGAGWIGEGEDRVLSLLDRIEAILGPLWGGLRETVFDLDPDLPNVALVLTLGRFMQTVGVRGEALGLGLQIEELVQCMWEARRNMHKARRAVAAEEAARLLAQLQGDTP